MRLKIADSPNQKSRSVGLVVVKSHISSVTYADKKFPAARLLFRYDPRNRPSDLQDLGDAVGCEYSDCRVRHGANPGASDKTSLGEPAPYGNLTHLLASPIY